MTRWMLLFAVMGTCFGAVAEGETVRVPADQPTLFAAVEAAPPGGTVELAAGKHLLPAGVRVTKPLLIKGESPETTILQTTVLEGEALLAEKADGFTLEGVTIEYTGPAPPDGRTDFPSLLSVAGGRADVSNCVFRNSAGFGVFYKEGVTGSVKKCRVEGSNDIGIYVKDRGTSVTLEGNSVNKNGKDGIGLFDDAAGAISGNNCVENGENGITVTAAVSGEVPVSGNTCEKNRWDGIRACMCSKVRIEGNVCLHNGDRGIAVDTGGSGLVIGNTCIGSTLGVDIRSAGTVATAEGNTCSETGEAGISVYFAGKGTVRKNICTKNRWFGVRVSHWESQGDVLENVCTDNGRSGIVVDQGARATVRGNESQRNGGFGIVVSDEDSQAEMTDNTTSDNGSGEVEKLEGVPGRRQYQVRNYEIGAAFLNGQTQYLDRVAARLRKYKSRYCNGAWQLSQFYEGLLYGNSDLNFHKRPDFRIALEKWAAEMPDSATPRTALAMTHKTYAWQARGGGYAREVTTEGWKGFRKHLELAEKWCADAESKPDRDAQLYATWVWIAMGDNDPESRRTELFEKGLALDSEYLELYTCYCTGLWPRWGGSRKEIERFFAEVHERTKESMGEKMYAVVADSQFCSGAVYGDSADWALVSKGFDQLLEEFPESPYYLNRYCLLACFHKDKEKAKALFDRIGDEPHLPAWEYEKAKFAQARHWARFDAPWPDLFRIEGEPPGNADERTVTPGAVVSTVMRMLLK